MGKAIPGQVVLGGMRKARECEPEEESAKQCSSVASALVPALTSCLALPSLHEGMESWKMKLTLPSLICFWSECSITAIENKHTETETGPVCEIMQ